ncbi:hypothetical protein [Qipengyuania qiaonensis]|uniref:Uncharacterized protein n=1 Tax=Qipengyuania qiaonensis TaxID=2867240 RepID=A0ABS7JB96_9SPHN|nr:hypothetical protein [Qipengyuania qiaonensis]MBX7483334.1 hypothetical protein [Qipengyuania qiaonensis]
MIRIAIAAPCAIALGLLTVDAGALLPARVAIASLGARAIGHDLRIEGSFTGKICSRGTSQVAAVRRAGSNRDAKQRQKPEALNGSKDLVSQVWGHDSSFQLAHRRPSHSPTPHDALFALN